MAAGKSRVITAASEEKKPTLEDVLIGTKEIPLSVLRDCLQRIPTGPQAQLADAHYLLDLGSKLGTLFITDTPGYKDKDSTFIHHVKEHIREGIKNGTINKETGTRYIENTCNGLLDFIKAQIETNITPDEKQRMEEFYQKNIKLYAEIGRLESKITQCIRQQSQFTDPEDQKNIQREMIEFQGKINGIKAQIEELRKPYNDIYKKMEQVANYCIACASEETFSLLTGLNHFANMFGFLDMKQNQSFNLIMLNIFKDKKTDKKYDTLRSILNDCLNLLTKHHQTQDPQTKVLLGFLAKQLLSLDPKTPPNEMSELLIFSLKYMKQNSPVSTRVFGPATLEPSIEEILSKYPTIKTPSPTHLFSVGEEKEKAKYKGGGLAFGAITAALRDKIPGKTAGLEAKTTPSSRSSIPKL